VEALQVVELQFSVSALPRLYFGEILQFFCDVFYCEEVVADTLVYLEVADVYLDVFTAGFALVEDVAEGAGDQSAIFVATGPTGHREGFAGTSLTIGEDGAIEAL
jgi:hypothetical protein